MGNGPRLVLPGSIIASIILVLILLSITDSPGKYSSGNQVAFAASEGPAQEPGADGAMQSGTETGVSPECQISPQFPGEILQWCGLITQYSGQHGLDPDLIAALIWQESGGNPLAYSKSGAVGLMQVMPRDGLAESFMCVNGPCFSNRPSIQELQEPEFNIRFGTKMLAGLLQKKGDIREALKSYGPMDVGYYYADKVLGIYNNHRD